MHCYLHKIHFFSRAYKRAGFTIVELLVVITIVAVLASLAGPSYRALIDSQAVDAATQDLRSAMSFARGKALGAGTGGFQVCSANLAANANNCNGAGLDWSSGWIVYDSVSTTVAMQYVPRAGVAVDSDNAVINFSSSGFSTAPTQFTVTAGASVRVVNLVRSGITTIN